MKDNSTARSIRFSPDSISELSAEPTVGQWSRPDVRGKFLWVGEQKLYVRGVTYGPFQPDAFGTTYPTPEKVKRDFRFMSANGINAIRTYNAPPRWLLDLAQQCGLRVMVGLQAERHFAFLEEQKAVRD